LSFGALERADQLLGVKWNASPVVTRCFQKPRFSTFIFPALTSESRASSISSSFQPVSDPNPG
jgi:hypothetical protein